MRNYHIKSVSSRNYELIIVDKNTFFRILTAETNANVLSLQPCIYPPLDCPVEIVYHQFRFGPGEDLTYILSYRNYAWLDEQEYSFFSPWIYHFPGKKPCLFFNDVCTIDYIMPNCDPCVWISAGLSRGSHSFHYAHYVVDHLMAVSFVSSKLSSKNAVFIQDRFLIWQKQLLTKFYARFSILAFPRVSSNLLTNGYPKVCAHIISSCVFDYSPFMSSDNSRSALIKAYIDEAGLKYSPISVNQVSESHPVVCSTNILFLSRSKMHHKRIQNEEAFTEVIKDYFVNTIVINPEDCSPSDIIDFIDLNKPVVISAASGALDPLMLLCKSLPRIIMFLPFTIDEIYSHRKSGVYSIIADIRNSANNFVPLGVRQASSSSGWNTPLSVDLRVAAALFGFLRVQSEWSRCSIEAFYYSQLFLE